MEAPKHVYISGPMRAYRGFNFPAFFEAEARVRSMWPEADICNPAREDVVRFGLQHLLAADPTGLRAGVYLQDQPNLFTPDSLRMALGADLDYICQHADLLVMLPGWKESSGAQAEVAAARALGVDVVEFDHPVSVYTEESDEPVATFDRLAVVEKEEVRTTSKTGGAKGVKLAAFDQVSPEVEMLVAEHFGKGARKYDAHNFRKGYEWSKSYSALRRHLAAFWAGEEYDKHLPTCPEDCSDHTESLHIVAVIWHAMVLTEFYLHHKEYDDRYVYAQD